MMGTLLTLAAPVRWAVKHGGSVSDQPKSFWERTFDAPQIAKYGCIGSLIACFAGVIGLGAMVGQCSAKNRQEAARQEVQAAADRKQQTIEVAQLRAKGLNCLSGLDGSEPDVVEQVKGRIRDPDSFQHIKTVITPAKNGAHQLMMLFRSKNGFGGMTEGVATATVLNLSDRCVARLTSVRG